MNGEESDRLRELCMLAQNERDAEKLVGLIRQINRIFEIAEAREGKEAKDSTTGENCTPEPCG